MILIIATLEQTIVYKNAGQPTLPPYPGWLFLSKQQGVRGLGKCFVRKEKYNDKYMEKDTDNDRQDKSDRE